MPVPLSQSSAFVLVCDKGQSYKTNLAKEFLSSLDLSEGKKMYDKTLHLQPRLNESIYNRKFFIHNFIKKNLKAKPLTQVLVLACGWDPLLLELSEEFPHSSFFGVDSESVDLQKQWIQKIKPVAPVCYLCMDLTHSHQLIEALSKKGWKTNQASLIVIEGISYYISPNLFWNSIKNLKQSFNSEVCICGDFLVNVQNLSQTARKFSKDLFDRIKKTYSKDYFSYTEQEIKKNLEDLKFSTIQFFKQADIQKQRTGTSKPWGKKDSHIQLFCAQNPIKP